MKRQRDMDKIARGRASASESLPYRSRGLEMSSVSRGSHASPVLRPSSVRTAASISGLAWSNDFRRRRSATRGSASVQSGAMSLRLTSSKSAGPTAWRAPGGS
jgi:hypothetical protein